MADLPGIGAGLTPVPGVFAPPLWASDVPTLTLLFQSDQSAATKRSSSDMPILYVLISDHLDEAIPLKGCAVTTPSRSGCVVAPPRSDVVRHGCIRRPKV